MIARSTSFTCAVVGSTCGDAVHSIDFVLNA